MKRLPDRKKLRREYLRKKGGAYALATLCGVCFLPVAASAIGCSAAAIVALQRAVTDSRSLSLADQTLSRQVSACQAQTPDINELSRRSESECYGDAFREHDQASARLRDREDRETRQASTLVVLALGAWSCTLGLRSGMRRARRAARRLYGLPVSALTLLADEILVRGSEEPPVVQSEVLLRAAQEQETPKEELLRVSQE